MILLVAFVAFNCSSDEGSTMVLDQSLLYGQWYRVGLCPDQNSLLLNVDGTYVSFSSGAEDCENPESDTYKYTGTYDVIGNFYYPIELTSELIIEGTNLSISDVVPTNLKREIIELTEDALVIMEYADINGIRYDYGTYAYEH